MAMAEIVELPPSTYEAPTPPVDVPAEPSVRATEVYVVFTSPEPTVEALHIASDLANNLGGGLRLVDFRVVPFGAQIDDAPGRSPVEIEDFIDRVRGQGIHVQANVYVCRDIRRVIAQVFDDHSLIVMGARRRWWPTREDRLRRLLEDRGHFVLFVTEPMHA